MADRDQLRWLLRILAEPPFLRLYVEGSGTCDSEPRRFEDAFWSLAPDLEHPQEARDPAWRRLASWLPRAPFAPAHAFRAVLARLCTDPDIDRKALHDLARFWSLPELFPEAPAGSSAGAILHDYHELHCHLRGAVPYLHLWQSWLRNERWRACLRTLECRSGAWGRTWAELVEYAAGSWQRLATMPALHGTIGASPPPAVALRRLAVLVRTSGIDGAAPLDDEQLACAVRYLALCAGLRRRLLHQRGRAGLSEFTDSYQRYSTLQKAPGRPQDELRDLVPAVLRRFEQDGAVAVELRPTLDPTRVAIQRKLAAVIWGYLDYLAEAERPVLMGLVPSLFKQEGIDRSDTRAPITWQRQSEIWCAQVDALLAVIDEVPALRWFVVGLDAAGRERGCPPRMLERALARVRSYHARYGLHACPPGRVMAAGWLRELACEPDRALAVLNERPITRVRLGLTVHAGEDFVDPVTGLRHIWESLHTLALDRGDRIGHALAAGLDRCLVRKLLERRSRQPDGDVQKIDAHRFRLRKPRGEHLLDLAWMHRMRPAGPGAQRVWTMSLAEAATVALGVPVDADRLASTLNAADAPVTMLVPALHYADAGDIMPPELTWVTVDEHWFDAFEELRGRVVDELRRRHVVVESCPTSNLAVAGLDEPPLKVFLNEGVPCAVATDDPGLLGVWPAEEFESRGLSEKDRVRLLNQATRAAFVRLRG